MTSYSSNWFTLLLVCTGVYLGDFGAIPWVHKGHPKRKKEKGKGKGKKEQEKKERERRKREGVGKRKVNKHNEMGTIQEQAGTPAGLSEPLGSVRNQLYHFSS